MEKAKKELEKIFDRLKVNIIDNELSVQLIYRFDLEISIAVNKIAKKYKLDYQVKPASSCLYIIFKNKN